ncbi:MAG: peptidoglycan DD-metalloendopeptidase family protein [Patescibacteria group bacterium]
MKINRFVLLLVLVLIILFILRFFVKDDTNALNNPPVLYNLGVEFGKYNPETGYAGDFRFEASKAYANKMFFEFGAVFPYARRGELVVHYIYNLPSGTPIQAMTNGNVTTLREQKESSDYELLIIPDGAPDWRLGYDHIVNPKFNKGERVNAGDIVGEVPFESGTDRVGFSTTEITVFTEGYSDEAINNFCPYIFLENSVKKEYETKIYELVKDWEIYVDDANIYNEENWVLPGCLYEKLNEAAALRGEKPSK